MISRRSDHLRNSVYRHTLECGNVHGERRQASCEYALRCCLCRATMASDSIHCITRGFPNAIPYGTPYTVLPLALVYAPIGAHELAAAVVLAVLELAFVHGTVGARELAAAVGPVPV